MGALSNPFPLRVGSAIGQVPQAQPASTNYVLYSGVINAPAAAPATTNATATAQANCPDFGATSYVIAPTVALGYVRALTPLIPAGLANGAVGSIVLAPVANGANQIYISFGVFGGSLVSMLFNPQTGAIISASTTAVSVSSFKALGKTYYRIGLGLPASLTNFANVQLEMFVRDNAGGTGAAFSWEQYGFQMEGLPVAGTAGVPTSYIATGAQINTRPNGAGPLQTFPPLPRQILATGGVTINLVQSDNGAFIYSKTGANTVNLPANPVPGTNFSFLFDTYDGVLGGTLTVNSPNGTLTNVILPTGIAAPGFTGLVNTLTIPSTALGANVNSFMLTYIIDASTNFGTWFLTNTASSHGILRYTAGGNFTPPNGVYQVYVTGCGAGGGGGGSTAGAGTSMGGGGGGGQGTVKQALAVNPQTTYAITIGAAGTSGAAGGGAGGKGGDTLFGGLLTLTGGSGGGGAPNNAVGSGGNAGSVNAGAGGNGWSTPTGNYILGGMGGSSIYGANHGMQNANSGASATSNAGIAGTSYGVGGQGGTNGAGSATGGAGGAGGAGILIIEW